MKCSKNELAIFLKLFLSYAIDNHSKFCTNRNIYISCWFKRKKNSADKKTLISTSNLLDCIRKFTFLLVILARLIAGEFWCKVMILSNFRARKQTIWTMRWGWKKNWILHGLKPIDSLDLAGSKLFRLPQSPLCQEKQPGSGQGFIPSLKRPAFSPKGYKIPIKKFK